MKYLVYIIIVWLLSLWACTPAENSQDIRLERDNNLKKFRDYDWPAQREAYGQSMYWEYQRFDRYAYQGLFA
ncbi:hypothetical protein [Flavilitoribacter nigricans]|uniref:Uncharacterized protein n=1 Tax=Flavilitoribacter nigricans (strain ATCC 23147 / DSM 23189 / NBRC 102662 / NCIMB 1420 / SS-2) TaxID=1122177 RepID=A0A2D0NFY0_FLAN2|nr:hypothetical protein [Flavilitoribacter nigricans]PHN07401.1 hypothetical protein CRP01_07160 [Flavilitoribacter nigricans DSM 23189 = NBRC 102662]